MTVWRCDSCNTNNADENSCCRRCQRRQGSASGTTVVAPVTVVPAQTAKPRFVQSRHARISLHPTPPPVLRPPPAPVPPPAPALRPGGGARKVLFWLVAAAAVFLVGKSVLPDLLAAPADSATAPPTTVACPAAVAAFLPESGAELIAQYRSHKHEITLCRGPSGQAYYDGVVIGQPRSDKWHLSLKATKTAQGYRAVNGNYSYDVTGSEVIITSKSKQSRAKLTRIAP